MPVTSTPQALPGRTLMVLKSLPNADAFDRRDWKRPTGREMRRSNERQSRTWKITPEMRAVIRESGKNWNQRPIQKQGFA